MRIVKAPRPYDTCPRPWVFLAGSIEMDRAARWQDEVAEALADAPGTILNPRRDRWGVSGSAGVRRQIRWELEALEAADLILLHLDPATRSPVSMLELGLHA